MAEQEKQGVVRRILNGMNRKVNRWLNQEEQAVMQSQEEGMSQAEMFRNFMENMRRQILEAHEQHQKAQAEYEKCRAEDHSQPPSEEDVARYYRYHNNYVGNMEQFKAHGAWMTEEVALIPEDEFKAKAAEGGWTYLRTSAGMQLGPIDGQAPWKAEGHGQGWKQEGHGNGWKTE